MDYPQTPVHFFGKLHQTRDFIVSTGFTHEDSLLWEQWFNRCVHQQTLVSFATQKNWRPSLWLFYLKSYNTVYVGFAALSHDKAKRDYPFIMFERHSADTEPSILSARLEWCFAHQHFFRDTLESGRVVSLNFWHQTLPPPAFDLPFLQEQFTPPKNAEAGSFWFDCNSHRHLAHEGLPTCFLFRKLFR